MSNLRILTTTLYLASLLVLSGCAPEPTVSYTPPKYQQPSSILAGTIWHHMRNNFQLSRDDLNQPQVQAKIRWYQAHPNSFYHKINNAGPYLHYILSQTQAKHLPAEVALLPLIESGYDPFAYSWVGATGLWQMMPGTASGLGIEINWWFDGRRDIAHATSAAIHYLDYLHHFFDNDWLLALAAYDSGEGRVQQAVEYNLQHHLPIRFWDLRLPRETQGYIPKLLAVKAIVENPHRYGFSLPPITDQPYLKRVDIPHQIDLAEVAKIAEIDLMTFHQLNPGFRRWATQPKGKQQIMIPASKAQIFKQHMLSYLQKFAHHPKISWHQYHVKPGDTLSNIAQRYHTKTHVIQQANHLHNTLIKPKQTLLIPASLKQAKAFRFAKMSKMIKADHLPGPKQKHHIVKRGESLDRIAHRHHLKPKQLIYWNKLTNPTHLKPGRDLVYWH